MTRSRSHPTAMADSATQQQSSPVAQRAVWETTSAAATHALGKSIGRSCEGGEVIALIGQLGTGKTCLVRGVAVGLGVSQESVASPTFALIHEYRGRVPVCHVDLYRLEKHEAEHGLGLEEYTEPPSVTLIEWADKAPAVLPRNHLKIVLEHLGGDRRCIALHAQGARYEALVARILA